MEVGMFIARRELNDLREENRKLKLQLAEAQEADREYNRRSAIIDKAALPKCKSIACSGCKHIVVLYTTWGGWYVLGCGKYNPCKDYEPTDITPEKAEAIREALNIQWQYN
jgi:hypothetical protein|nr:MAG TPA: hypothetical protein [Caudoviricetes sp.]